jgi:hypothetical protein
MKKISEELFFQNKLNSLLVKLEFETMERIKLIYQDFQHANYLNMNWHIEVSMTYIDKKENEHIQEIPYSFYFKEVFTEKKLNMFCDQGMIDRVALDYHRIRGMEWPELSEPYCVLFYDLLWHLIAFNDTPIIDRIWVDIKLINDFTVPIVENKTDIDLRDKTLNLLNRLNNTLKPLEFEIIENVKKFLVYGEAKLKENKGSIVDYDVDIKIQYCNENSDDFIYKAWFPFNYKRVIENHDYDMFLDGGIGIDEHREIHPKLSESYCHLLHELLDNVTTIEAVIIDSIFYELHYTEQLGIKVLANGESRKLEFDKQKKT